MPPAPNDAAAWLKNARQRRGLTQEALARLLAAEDGSLTYEAAKRRVERRDRKKILKQQQEILSRQNG